MTTPSSPDGQPPQTPSPTPPNPEGGEPIRNWDDVKKIVVTREEFKAENKELRALLEGVIGELKGMKPATPPDGQQPQTPPSPLEAKLDKIATVVDSIVGDKQNEAKQQRRKAITEAVVASANESGRELVRHALATLALDGAVDLHAENTTAEVAKAIEKLRASHPGSFTSPQNPQGATGGQHDLIPPGVALHELTADQLARLSDEDFSKLRRAARTSKLAV